MNQVKGAVRVVEGDRIEPVLTAPIPVVGVLDNLRSAFNVGNIFRLAEATRVLRLVTCGYTASPPHPKLARTARGCDTLVPCCRFDTAAAAVQSLRDEGFTTYGVETVDGAASPWQVQFSFPAAFVFGNEALGVSREALDQCDAFVQLPCFGRKNSINVGNCAAVVFFQAVEQWLAQMNYRKTDRDSNRNQA